MKVTILGNAPPRLTMQAGRAGTGLLVSEGNSHLLIDCGPGVANRLDAVGVEARNIDAVLLTHHHWDHVADLAFFVLGRWETSMFGAVGGKPFAKSYRILGPGGTRLLADRLFGEQGAFRPEMDTRLAPEFGVALYRARGIPEPFPPMVPDVEDLGSGATTTVGPFTIRTTTAAHCQPYINSLAYRVDSPTGSMVFTGDSAPSPAIQRLADGADLLLHDCNINKKVRAELNGKGIHTSQEEVGRVAAAAKVGRLIIVHHGLEPVQAPQMSDEVQKQFDGPITVANDLDSFVTDRNVQ